MMRTGQASKTLSGRDVEKWLPEKENAVPCGLVMLTPPGSGFPGSMDGGGFRPGPPGLASVGVGSHVLEALNL